MIRIREATMLALTKLRTRKVRLTVTIVISGLLFSVLAAASIGARGIFASIDSFSSEGFSNRYLTQSMPLSNNNYAMNSDIMDRAIAINKDTIAQKKAEAKRLGIEYQPETDSNPVETYPSPNGKDFRTLNVMHPAAKQAVEEYVAAHPQGQPGLDVLKKEAAAYKATNFYESLFVPYDLGGASVAVMKGGEENYDNNTRNQNGPPKGIDSFTGNWSLMSSNLLKPFILPGQDLTVGDDGSIPIIVPVSAAEELLNIKALKGDASTDEQLERTRTIREAAKAIAFDVCYRNATSADLLQQAISAKQETELNKNKKDYRKPDFQYGLPAAACGDVPVVRDVRTKDQKTQDAKQQQFLQKFGQQPATQSTVRFRVVGLVPDANYDMATNVSQIIASLVNSSLGSGWYAPMEVARENPLIDQLFFTKANPATAAPTMYYTEFANADTAKAFIDERNCEPDYSNYDPTSTADPNAKCTAAGKSFTVMAYGSNSLGLESAKDGFTKIFSLVGLGIAVIACIIMMGTVGKMIADSRRETAVFRAIGAKKLDIAQIYVLYTIFLSVLITLFAVLLGTVFMLWANAHWSAEVTAQAILAYNAQDMDKQFHLYSLYLPDLLYLLGIAVTAGLLSAVFPLIRSLRRNPIRDMRDDT